MRNVVILIGGKGTSGKSTFISYVQEILGADKCREFSTIDPAKMVVRFMAALENDALTAGTGIDLIEKLNYLSPLQNEIDEKSDTYRSLLHDIKMLWCDVDDGPNLITFSLVQKFFMDNGKFAFVNCREPEQFDHIKNIISKDKPDWNVVTLNVYRSGYGEDITNEGDKTTNNYSYNYTVNNSGTLEQLKEQAQGLIEILQSVFKD